MKSGTIFDNFLITDDEEYAEEFGNETWGETKDPEKKMKDEVIAYVCTNFVRVIEVSFMGSTVEPL